MGCNGPFRHSTVPGSASSASSPTFTGESPSCVAFDGAPAVLPFRCELGRCCRRPLSLWPHPALYLSRYVWHCRNQLCDRGGLKTNDRSCACVRNVHCGLWSGSC